VPAWFAHTLPILAAPGVAQISSGWKQLGTVELVSHSRFAYRSLWKSVYEMCLALALAGLIGGWLGTLVLRRLRKPLDAVIGQAQAITERRFVKIAEPAVPELRQLAIAMNATVGRLKGMFEEEAVRLEAVRREANCDPLTGLANRGNFLGRLRTLLEGEESHGGSIVLLRIADLAGINRRIGREGTDDLLKLIGAAVAQVAAAHPEALGARLNGADFALLLPDASEPRRFAEKLQQMAIEEAEPFVGEGATLSIGLGRFPAGLETGAVLAHIDAALAAAEAQGVDGICEASFGRDDEAPKSGEEWAQLIRRALEQHWVRLISFPVADLAGRTIHRECPLRLMFDEQGEWLPAGRFLPMAERLRLTPQLDLAAISLGIEQLETDVAMPALAINLSASSVQDETFREQLLTRLGEHPQAASRLWLEVAESGALRHLEAFRSFVGSLKGSGCRIGLEHFGRQFSQIGRLHDLGLDYLKVDASFIRGLENNAGNRTFLKGLSGIAHSIGLQVYAEGVVSGAELRALGEVGFDGATGPAIRDAQ
jgi:EAL domain-containing protein (putative c-di-GMP-specific phosphodiesterase class I)/GGDEF domain-containing protein